MDDATKADIQLHVAGATVRHRSPFQDLEAHRNATAYDADFLREWVVPVYGVGLRTDPEDLATYTELVPRLTGDVLLRMLGEFNWRARIAGA